MIRHAGKALSNIKSYYVRNVIKPVGRHDYFEGSLSQYEKESLKYNHNLRAKNRGFFDMI